MNSSTVAALNRINRRFYDRHSQAFSASRSRPWPGWKRALSPFLANESGGASGEVVRAIVDVGCGNGRFGLYLGSMSAERFRYLGIDSSREMIQRAQGRLAGHPSIDARFEQRELTNEEPLEHASGSVDLITLFGVLHHIPGLACRQRLLEDLRKLLAPRGLMVFSFWQFGNRERFRRRFLDWSEHSRVSGDPIDERQLETGDFLLTWGNAEGADLASQEDLGPRRYCHHADVREAQTLADSLRLHTLDRFESDGRGDDLNLYFVLQNCD